MDNPTPQRPPLGLAALITATVTLFSPMGMDSAREGFRSQSLAEQAILALRSSDARRNQSPFSSFRSHNPIGPEAKPSSPELPADLRTARLVLSVESLFKATTPN